MKIYPYKRGLASTASLVAAGIGVLYPSSRPSRGTVCHSWGMSTIPSWSNRVRWTNNPAATKLVSNKLNWARWCANNVPNESLLYTTKMHDAQGWANGKGNKVVCRTKINGSGGDGIVIARNQTQVVEAPLYSLYFEKTSEYRVMYSPTLGVVFLWSKRRPKGHDMDRDNLLIRTASSGYVYQREDANSYAYLDILRAVANVAVPLQALGLELLAYDVVYNSNTSEVRVVEANTAPGLGDDSSLEVADALKQLEQRL